MLRNAASHGRARIQAPGGDTLTLKMIKSNEVSRWLVEVQMPCAAKASRPRHSEATLPHRIPDPPQLGRFGAGEKPQKHLRPFFATSRHSGRGQTIAGAAAMPVPSSIDTGTPAPAIRLPLDPAPTQPRERLFSQELGARLDLQARSLTMRRWTRRRRGRYDIAIAPAHSCPLSA